MKTLAILVLAIVLIPCAGYTHYGGIALYVDETVSDCDYDTEPFLPVEINLYYMRGQGPEIGNSYEFRILVSSPQVVLLEPIWPPTVTVTLGTLESGITVAHSECLGIGQDVTWLGTIPIMSVGDVDTFMVTVVGDPTSLFDIRCPRGGIYITLCDRFNSMHEVIGGYFMFNGPCNPADPFPVHIDPPPPPGVQCPNDTTIPPLSWHDMFQLNGFEITNTADICLQYYYHLTAVGTLVVVDPGQPGSLSGITPVLVPGETYAPPEARLRLVVLREWTQEFVTYYATTLGYPGISDSCTTTITVEPPQELAVLITHFEAIAIEGGVNVTWSIVTDEELAGFNLYRSTEQGSVGECINRYGLIPPSEMEYIDTSAKAGKSYYYTLGVIGTGGSEKRSVSHCVKVSPVPLALHQNYPNPFNPVTSITFTLPVDSHVILSVYDVKGRLLKCLVNRRLSSGLQRIEWDGRDMNGVDVATGIYFYRLKVGKEMLSRKMVLLR
ncbi:MAG: T9SS type A sorting domain-containing protein [candidate division WOR-3 bacterium]|nr:MAG: T9SS type A sorting domain-containing protein [candidate division WOR-3 bacterium]UCF06922.1 MAG: T9SS type A sorting domain-containing protein [bacterium]